MKKKSISTKQGLLSDAQFKTIPRTGSRLSVFCWIRPSTDASDVSPPSFSFSGGKTTKAGSAIIHPHPKSRADWPHLTHNRSPPPLTKKHPPTLPSSIADFCTISNICYPFPRNQNNTRMRGRGTMGGVWRGAAQCIEAWFHQIDGGGNTWESSIYSETLSKYFWFSVSEFWCSMLIISLSSSVLRLSQHFEIIYLI